MNPALVISKREIRAYFNSPVAYIVVTVFTILTGYLFFTQLFLEKQADMRPFFGVMPLLFMFVIPAITMRLVAEEKGSGTLELLITMPIRDWEVILGKFLAALFLFGKLTQFVPESIQPIISFLSIDGHFENISRGVIDSRDVIYYLSVIAVCLLVATTSLESRKWK